MKQFKLILLLAISFIFQNFYAYTGGTVLIKRDATRVPDEIGISTYYFKQSSTPEGDVYKWAKLTVPELTTVGFVINMLTSIASTKITDDFLNKLKDDLTKNLDASKQGYIGTIMAVFTDFKGYTIADMTPVVFQKVAA